MQMQTPEATKPALGGFCLLGIGASHPECPEGWRCAVLLPAFVRVLDLLDGLFCLGDAVVSPFLGAFGLIGFS